MENITLIGAFSAGMLTFLSPCILPLIPIYMAMIIGSSNFHEIKKGEIVFRTLLFVLGFAFIFIILGLSSTWLGNHLLKNIAYFKKMAGFMIIILGFILMDIIKINILQSSAKFNFKYKLSYTNNFLLGAAFGFSWTPCVGPILASILILASTSGKTLIGIKLLALYTIGLSLPFFLIALMGEGILKRVKLIQKYSKTIKLLSAITLIVLGIIVLLNKI